MRAYAKMVYSYKFPRQPAPGYFLPTFSLLRTRCAAMSGARVFYSFVLHDALSFLRFLFDNCVDRINSGMAFFIARTPIVILISERASVVEITNSDVC